MALRNLRASGLYALINIGGLAVSIAACLLIGGFVAYQQSFDDFHEEADRIYRIATTEQSDGQTRRTAFTPIPLKRHISALPGVEKVTTIGGIRRQLVGRNEQQFFQEGVGRADEEVFEVFSFPLKRGNPPTALARPFTAVITPSVAEKYFGSEDPTGRTLTIDQRDYTVTGIFEPLPPNSHLQFSILTSSATNQELYGDLINNWRHSVPTYLLLGEGVSAAEVEEGLQRLLERSRPENADPSYSFVLQPLTSIYLHSNLDAENGATGSLQTIYLFSVIGVVILLLACINYMNLATAHSTRRAREVGVRKVVGSSRAQLAGQFLTESLLTAGIGTAGGAVLAYLLLPRFNRLVAAQVPAAFVETPVVIIVLLVAAVVVGLLAGIYPALVLSSYRPSKVLKGAADGRGLHPWLRRSLVIFQFAMAVILMISAGVVYQQLGYVQEKNLGFDKEQVLTVPLRDAERIPPRYEAFKQELRRQAGISQVSAGFSKLGRGAPSAPLEANSGQSRQIKWIGVDFDFVEALGINVLQGRSFSPEFGTDSTTAFMLNRAAVRALGWDDPVGRDITFRDRRGTVIGVVENFHYASLREPVQPLVLHVMTEPAFYSTLYVRFGAGSASSVVDEARRIWKEFYPMWPFEYSFLDQTFARLYEQEQRIGTAFGYFALLALVIGGLGLFGLSALSARQRIKEIGIRKVLGATAAGMVGLLSKDFLKLVGIAIVVAAPLAYLAMNRWLQDFAYRIDLGPSVFLGAGLIAVGVASLTISYQSIKAALTNPADTLRYE